MRELGRCIRDIREAANMSADELADKVGIQSGPTITRFETGRAQSPTFETVYRLVDYLGNLDIIKNNDFDFGNYSPATAKIINAFRVGERTQEYKNCKDEFINFLYQNKQNIPTAVLEAITFFVQSNIAFQNINEILTLMDSEIKTHNEKISNIPHTEMLCNLLKQNNEEFNGIIANMIETKTPNSVSEYTYRALSLLYAYILAYFKPKGADNANL